jgi:dUTPase
VKTDLQIEVPPGTYGRVAPRSGLAWKNHIDVGAGVIDADYRYDINLKRILACFVYLLYIVYSLFFSFF